MMALTKDEIAELLRLEQHGAARCYAIIKDGEAEFKCSYAEPTNATPNDWALHDLLHRDLVHLDEREDGLRVWTISPAGRNWIKENIA